jgi:electron transfer flavoprotein beta subunit
MDVIVCIKRVPEVAEVDLQVDPTGKGIKEGDLVFSLNDWDNYAVEEAVRIKEKQGGKVTAIMVGPEESEDVLRRALALGADEAVRVTDPAIEGSDAYAIAKVLAAVIKDIPYDVILTGVQANDDGYAQVGATLAELLGVPHATLVTAMEINEKRAKVHRELEGGMEEVLECALPALFTIQSGINEPRYVSIMGIRKVAQKEIKVLDLTTAGLSPGDVGAGGSMILIERIFPTPVGEGAEILTGSPDAVAAKVADIFVKGGVM